MDHHRVAFVDLGNATKLCARLLRCDTNLTNAILGVLTLGAGDSKCVDDGTSSQAYPLDKRPNSPQRRVAWIAMSSGSRRCDV